MNTCIIRLVTASLLSLLPHSATALTCPPDAVVVGPTCVDQYEASVWRILPDNQALVDRVRQGAVNREELLNGGVTQLGVTQDDYDSVGCQDTANGCINIYAASVPGVQPSSHLTWFQAVAACRNAGKRLLRNDEWQIAAFGPQEESGCNVDTGEKRSTGGIDCRADSGALDMIGNVHEWVADWRQGDTFPWMTSTGTTGQNYGQDAIVGTNHSNLSVNDVLFPSAVGRGGHAAPGSPLSPAISGVFALSVSAGPSTSTPVTGFRCGR